MGKPINPDARARELFGNHVLSVTTYTHPSWRDGGWKGWRVTVPGGDIHFMTTRGRHEVEVCCRRNAERPGQEDAVCPIVVRR